DRAYTRQTCSSAIGSIRKASNDGVKNMYRTVRGAGSNKGLTIMMVGGFGSHLTDQGAIKDSRDQWEEFRGQLPEEERRYFRVVRHECTPNSYAADEICAPKLVDKFKALEEEATA